MIITWSFNNGLVFGIDANEVVAQDDNEEIFMANAINIHLAMFTLRFLWEQQEE